MSTDTHTDVFPGSGSKAGYGADRRSPDVRAAVSVFPSAFLAGRGLFGLRCRSRPIGKGRSVLAGALFTLGLVVGLVIPTDVKASIFYPGDSEFDALSFTISPTLAFTASPPNAVYSDDSAADVNPQNPAHVKTVLQSAAWFDTGMLFIGGGACGGAGVSCDGPEGSGEITLSGVTANVFGIHFDNKFIAFLYDTPISAFSISGLDQGVSNIYAYLVPLPAALPLYGSALAVLGLIGWRRKRMAA